VDHETDRRGDSEGPQGPPEVRIILDTNVLLSAFLGPTGTCRLLLDLVLKRRVRLLVDDRILDEYREVLPRPEFGLDPRDCLEFIENIEAMAERAVGAPIEDDLPDEEDRRFIECAIGGLADCIVTGNKRHFPAGACRGIPVLSPRELLNRVVGANE